MPHCYTLKGAWLSGARLHLSIRHPPLLARAAVAFKVYDIDRDGYISNGELFLVLKMMVGNNLKDQQLQQIVDKTIMEADQNGDGKIDFEEFKMMVANTDIAKQMTLDGGSSAYPPCAPLRCAAMLMHAVRPRTD